MTQPELQSLPVSQTSTNIPVEGRSIKGSMSIFAYGKTVDFQTRNLTKKQTLRLLLKIVQKII